MLFRQRCCLKICTDRFVVRAGCPSAAVLAAKLCNVGFTGHEALFCQNGGTIHIFQNRKASLFVHFGVAAFDQLLGLPEIIYVPDSPAPPQTGPCGPHGTGQLFGKVNNSPGATSCPERSDSIQTRRPSSPPAQNCHGWKAADLAKARWRRPLARRVWRSCHNFRGSGAG